MEFNASPAVCACEGKQSEQAGGVSCGDTVCLEGQVCCNESCGICTPPGGFCTQQFCN